MSTTCAHSPHRLARIGGNKATDLDVPANTDIPDYGFLDRVTCVTDDCPFWYSPPNPIDRHPVTPGTHVVNGPLPIGDIATRPTIRDADTLEPGSDIIWDIFKLSTVHRMHDPRGEEQSAE
jgi:hypothetical protein